ncbi:MULTISPECIES: pantetheine-phosphate adenylyltransferase [Weeksella]|uniref:Phosphopantetheine adenylyltransferase n=1 Tax=Weeksella virosa (strain ATCC 43766 / DSM 16922 / JCM 21250 / CCUG 30538 / CDC 9751 / IAM 14551 / NBRC 16016 / NCTC 11634 / CL345/78) TaxID=865938 RepID=F0NZ98_WEEVC|nr:MULTISPECIES: pantetheine-phosphate adenylyltransferase [Weeksella]ADX67227.1 Phosphopantetheine adenylyltransferase [Weeksella virosa DSM 16922]MDK7375036.1 pantetheine-phosphate adenylyltransferase [Weeksella virosa]MDK7675925.1 pantetheine-phosphate adenylyltransferase [Weeksella virosa]OFM81676.1 pantetheine-phosphate adenylyltransferase [Weeksella sp. HMSC059D05]SUP53496.1 Phosphopantetheine adenylyltransferase [Weeksella virosa]
MERIAVFPGSFDPITIGHMDIIQRAVPLFDKIIVAIGTNSAKKYMFSLEQRQKFIEKAVERFENVTVQTYDGLTIDFCLNNDARYILRGLRNPADFEFEKAIAHTNRAISNYDVETVFLLTSSGKAYISSSIVRDVMINGGEYKKLVPSSVKYKCETK